ncbi:hypothetical protein ICN46_03015 [Polynucleobacter sp. Latsch14-2]|jgi:hypothetical protein|uniref:DUF5672 family protein n=1 Tax=Polynucleobacter sp. Latsch14-2 TaxID=2576920 RepID=UPI001C0E558C|nr:DUF5672 family protein [Polynucleobacter sp. Latsch14-2]MBU3613872.1 hypothetical protein [Polynucleobacter sp. Latsch14-2]
MNNQKISAVIIDTYPNKTLPKLAIEKTLECGKIGKVYTFSDQPYFNGAEFVQIPEITDVEQYSTLMIDSLINYVHEDFIVIQWDGFVLNPRKWSDEFLNYDYIGAPHLRDSEKMSVGNGGFSFRTQKLMHAIKKIPHAIDMPEDFLICHRHRHELEQLGVKFPHLPLASRFSYQEGPVSLSADELFGFHGPWNFPKFFTEDFLMPFAKEIIERTLNFIILTLYLEECKNQSMHSLFFESVDSINRTPKTIELIDVFFRNKIYGGWAERFIKVMN